MARFTYYKCHNTEDTHLWTQLGPDIPLVPQSIDSLQSYNRYMGQIMVLLLAQDHWNLFGKKKKVKSQQWKMVVYY